MVCSICGQRGHNRSRCNQQPSIRVSTSSSQAPTEPPSISPNSEIPSPIPPEVGSVSQSTPPASTPVSRAAAVRFTSEELERIVTITGQCLPITGEEWNSLAAEFNRTRPSGTPARHGEALKQKFRRLVTGPPTGAGGASDLQIRAREVENRILTRRGSLDFPAPGSPLPNIQLSSPSVQRTKRPRTVATEVPMTQICNLILLHLLSKLNVPIQPSMLENFILGPTTHESGASQSSDEEQTTEGPSSNLTSSGFTTPPLPDSSEEEEESLFGAGFG